MAYLRKKRLPAGAYVEGILGGDKLVLSRAITLIESRLEEDNRMAGEVLEKILPATGKAIRVGITGVPGVGKSTFIDVLGTHITASGKKLAVLTIDPSSQRSKGSILGDKTRMEELARDPRAYIRPSATGEHIGGVAGKTREAMLLCEAAGHEVIIIETVGVGQSETAVHGMVDFFLLLMLAGAGDELQGIKRGIMEMADAIAINKADGDNRQQARKAQLTYQHALHLLQPSSAAWKPKVTTCSALEKEGIQDIWSLILDHREYMKKQGLFDKKRQEQQLAWMHDSIKAYLEARFYQNKAITPMLEAMEKEVVNGRIAAINAARQLIAALEENA